jgi:hypothetical protein
MDVERLPRDVRTRRPQDPAGLLEFSPDPVAPAPHEVRVSNVVLWLAALSGPVSWAVHLMLMYPGTEVACRVQTPVPLYILSAVFLGAAALGGLVNWRYLTYMRGWNGGTTPRRVRFMATAGLLGAALFLVLIVAGTLPVAFDDPCQLQGRRRPTLIPFL